MSSRNEEAQRSEVPTACNILNKMAERPGTADLHKAFRLFDPAGKRTIDFHDLKRIAGQIGEK